MFITISSIRSMLKANADEIPPQVKLVVSETKRRNPELQAPGFLLLKFLIYI